MPLSSHECPLDAVTEEPTAIPKLLRAYLAVGAKICGPPALDRQFKTIDFLTWLTSSKGLRASGYGRAFSVDLGAHPV